MLTQASFVVACQRITYTTVFFSSWGEGGHNRIASFKASFGNPYIIAAFALSQWCEARPECNRLELKQMLVTPMQRITRYTLLLNAIAKKTTVPEHKESLEKLVSMQDCDLSRPGSIM